MHVVLGDGTMPSKEMYAHLQGMKTRANKDGEGFWFLIQSKAEPSDTDRALVKWLVDNEVYFETISDDKTPEDMYQGEAGTQNHHTTKNLAPKVVELMEKVKVEEPDDSRLLGLFVSDDPESEEDRWLNDAVFAVADAGYKVFALNDGMAELDLVDQEGEEAMEEEKITMEVDLDTGEVTEKPTLSAVPDLPVTYTREELEEMDLTQVKALAAERGITLPPRTRFPTYIKALLGELTDTTPEAEVTDAELDELLEAEEAIEAEAITATDLLQEYQESLDNRPPPSTTLTGSAMMIIVANGHVTSRVITAEEAHTLLSM
jgi:hypothetical protein